MPLGCFSFWLSSLCLLLFLLVFIAGCLPLCSVVCLQVVVLFAFVVVLISHSLFVAFAFWGCVCFFLFSSCFAFC